MRVNLKGRGCFSTAAHELIDAEGDGEYLALIIYRMNRFHPNHRLYWACSAIFVSERP